MSEGWHAKQRDDWYEELLDETNWRALWGADGTGDLLKPGNLEHCARQIQEVGGVFLCVADGGFSDKAIPAKLLELYFYRLFLAELLTASCCLQPGGRLICKLYSSFSTATAALLFLATRLFEDVHIVKPTSSRVAGPERYLVGLGFRGNIREVQEAVAVLFHAHNFYSGTGGASPLRHPLLTPAVTAAKLSTDLAFIAGLRAMVDGLCWREAEALRAILDHSEALEAMVMGTMASAGARGGIVSAAIQDQLQQQQRQQQQQQEEYKKENSFKANMQWNRATKQHGVRR